MKTKRLKQGQTIYLVDGGYYTNPPSPYIMEVFLYSEKQKLPPLGCLIERMPVSHARLCVSFGTKYHTSRRKANTALKNLKIQQLTELHNYAQ